MRLFEVLGGWVATVPELDVKMRLGTHTYHHAWHAELWHKRLPELREMNQERLTVPPNDELVTFVEAMTEPEAPELTIEKLTGVYRVLIPRKIAAYTFHLNNTSTITDAPTIRSLKFALAGRVRGLARRRDAPAVTARHTRRGPAGGRPPDELEKLMLAAGGIAGPGSIGMPPSGDTATATGTATGACHRTAGSARETPPLRRRTRARLSLRTGRRLGPADRPVAFGAAADRELIEPSARRGGRRLEPSTSSAPDAARVMMHGIFVGEIQALEGAGRTCFDFDVGTGDQDVPFELKLDMARQCWDEARHVEISCKLADFMGTEIGEFGESTILFEAACNPDPVLRLAGVNRALEGLAIDVFNTMREFGEKSGDPVLEFCEDWMLADEVTHVKMGSDWLRRMTANDPEPAGAGARVPAGGRQAVLLRRPARRRRRQPRRAWPAGSASWPGSTGGARRDRRRCRARRPVERRAAAVLDGGAG